MGKDKSCEYVEVNEVIESTEYWNGLQAKKKYNDSDLVFLQLRLQNTTMWSWRIKKYPRRTQDRFAQLKEQYPEVFH